jgi:hypothetical protein
MDTPDPSESERASGPGGSSFLGVRRMEPGDDGVRLFDGGGAEIGLVPYGENVYVNGRVISFKRQGDRGYGQRER